MGIENSRPVNPGWHITSGRKIFLGIAEAVRFDLVPNTFLLFIFRGPQIFENSYY